MTLAGPNDQGPKLHSVSVNRHALELGIVKQTLENLYDNIY